MSDVVSVKKINDKTAIKAKKTTIKPKQKRNEVEDFRVWLATLPATPKLHINGSDYSGAVLAIDFGTPLEEAPKMTAEQNADLVAKMKSTTRFLFNKPEMAVRVQSDTTNGVWWTSLN